MVKAVGLLITVPFVHSNVLEGRQMCYKNSQHRIFGKRWEKLRRKKGFA